MLPRLLLSGVLCHASHIIIEWHLLAQPASERLSGLHLRHDMDHLLTKGCAAPPAVLEHFDFAPNNYGDVPGLPELAKQHTPEAVKARMDTMKGGRYAGWSKHWREMDAAAAA